MSQKTVGGLILAMAATLITVGCGDGPESTVSGLVTLDGKPLDRGSVSFIPTATGSGATATIRADGTFEARTGSSAGLQPGDYMVTVQARADGVANSVGAPPMPGKLLTPKKYSSTNTSGLRATISPGTNDLKLELSSDEA
jgi:hypothetical protein